MLAFMYIVLLGDAMTSLSVRKISPEILQALRLQAAKHGVSMEEEARRILQRGIQPQLNIGDIAKNLFGTRCGVDLNLPKHKPHNPLEFDE